MDILKREVTHHRTTAALVADAQTARLAAEVALQCHLEEERQVGS